MFRACSSRSISLLASTNTLSLHLAKIALERKVFSSKVKNRLQRILIDYNVILTLKIFKDLFNEGTIVQAEALIFKNTRPVRPGFVFCISHCAMEQLKFCFENNLKVNCVRNIIRNHALDILGILNISFFNILDKVWDLHFCVKTSKKEYYNKPWFLTF
jgi:hypothetical protein